MTADPANFHDAFTRGDIAAVKRALGDPPEFPNSGGQHAFGEPLEYAIYHSPLSFVRALLELGADPSYQDGMGFPSLIAALSTDRPDKYELLELLLSFGADIQQRGVNDYTPLHYAANLDDVTAIELLLAHGADPTARTNIDDYATPLEEAENLGRARAAEVLRRGAQG